MNHRLLLTVVWMLSSIGVALGGEIIKPEKPIVLFNGKDLSNFYTWIVDSHREDPDRVFSVVDQVDGAPALRVSGERWGGFVTTEAFRDYRLVVEFRWGPLTWGNRMDRTRDSGILLHCQGPDGNTKKDFNGPWMHSIEYQIIEGGVADFILVGGYDAAGNQKRPEFTASISKDRDGEMVYDRGDVSSGIWFNGVLDTEEFSMPGGNEKYTPDRLSKYSIGDKGSDEDMIIEGKKATAAAVAEIRPNDGAFVRRSGKLQRISFASSQSQLTPSFNRRFMDVCDRQRQNRWR